MWRVRIRLRWSGEEAYYDDHSKHYKDCWLMSPGPDKLDKLDLSDWDDELLDSPLSEEKTPSA